MGKYKSKNRTKSAPIKNALPKPFLLVLAGVVLLAGALFAVWNSGRPTVAQVPVKVNGSPSLKVNQDKIDLGNVSVGKTVSVSFQLSNIGDQALRFTETPYVEVAEGC